MNFDTFVFGFEALAKKYRPKGVEICWIPESQTSYTYYYGTRIVIRVPKPRNLYYLFNLFHEYAHVLYHKTYNRCRPRYMEEYQAMSYAANLFLVNKLPATKEIDKVNRAYLRECIWKATMHGLKKEIPEHVLNYAEMGETNGTN